MSCHHGQHSYHSRDYINVYITDSAVQLHTMCTCGWIDAACDFFYTSSIAMFILVLLAIIKCVVAANLDLKATTNFALFVGTSL